METSNLDTLRVGTTEGRFRMVMPDLMETFQQQHPETQLLGRIGNAEELREALTAGELDVAFSGLSPLAPECIEKRLLLDEKLYLVISDGLLERYFAGEAPGCAEAFKDGAELKRFEAVPFCFSLPHLHCMQMLQRLLDRQGVTLNCVHQSGHFDLHQELAARNYAACFCLTMYLPCLRKRNQTAKNKLHVFPIRGLAETNPVYVLTNRERRLPNAAEPFITLLTKCCKEME